MTTRTRTFVLLAAILLLSWAVLGSFIGCSNEKKQIIPPVVGPAAGSGPMGGGDTQRLQLTASPSETLTTIGEEQGKITVTALIENSIGQPMPNGTPIYWSTTQGSVSPTTGTSSNGSAEATVTFPKSFDGCTTVTARSGDVSATIWLCVDNVVPTPTPTTPPATPAPTATPAPAPTPVVSVSLTSSALNVVCATAGSLATLTATVYRDSIPTTDIPVSFSVSFSPALDTSPPDPATTTCFVNPTNPPVGTTTTDFYCSLCSGSTDISNATVRATAGGDTADVVISVTQ